MQRNDKQCLEITQREEMCRTMDKVYSIELGTALYIMKDSTVLEPRAKYEVFSASV